MRTVTFSLIFLFSEWHGHQQECKSFDRKVRTSYEAVVLLRRQVLHDVFLNQFCVLLIILKTPREKGPSAYVLFELSKN